MVHNPEHVYGLYDINLCGHVHEKWKFKKVVTSCAGPHYIINVGVDQWDFKPRNLQEIMKEFNKWLKSEVINVK